MARKSQSEYNREWRVKNEEYDRLRKRQWYLENREKLVEKAKKRLQRKRQKEGPKYRVGSTKSYLIVGNRVYFNSKLGFSEEEILNIAVKMREAAHEKARATANAASAGHIPGPNLAKQNGDLHQG